MSLFLFLTVVQAIVAAALVGLVLIQKSEGGGLGLGGGGSPGGLMSARGSADFLTRATSITAIVFVALSIALAAIAVGASDNSEISTTLDRNTAPAQPADPLDTAPGTSDAPADTSEPLGGEGLDGDPPVDSAPSSENDDPLADLLGQ